MSGYDKQNWKDVKRLGYSSATLKIEVAPEAPLTGSALARARKDMLKLPAALFCQSVLAYQLRSHEEFLANFSRVFRRLDSDVDGSLCRMMIEMIEMMWWCGGVYRRLDRTAVQRMLQRAQVRLGVACTPVDSQFPIPDLLCSAVPA